jgi:hypothetical protein
MLTQERLKELLHYNPETGIFTWRVCRQAIKNGSVAGTVNGRHYVQIVLDRRIYLAHRLAWLYMRGAFPSSIDHRDGNPSNNAWNNLRLATALQNGKNRKRSTKNTTGFKGVSWWRKVGKYAAEIRVDGKRIWLGHFDTAHEAYQVYCRAAQKYHGEFARLA